MLCCSVRLRCYFAVSGMNLEDLRLQIRFAQWLVQSIDIQTDNCSQTYSSSQKCTLEHSFESLHKLRNRVILERKRFQEVLQLLKQSVAVNGRQLFWPEILSHLPYLASHYLLKRSCFSRLVSARLLSNSRSPDKLWLPFLLQPCYCQECICPGKL